MADLARFGVSLESDLLEAFALWCKDKGYDNRSEAIRDLIRRAINEDQWGTGDICGGTLTLLYDHHRHDLAKRLVAIQHENHDVIISTMHVHLDHHNCLECLVLKGVPEAVRGLAQKLISCKGVKYGVFNHAPNGEDAA